jgi:uncharacterized protein (TIGR00251 family)
VKVSVPPPRAVIEIHLLPRASRTAIGGVRDGALLVRTVAAPVDGAANDSLLELLARSLHVPRRSLSIVSGERSRRKRVAVHGVGPDALAARLAELIDRAPG